MTNGTLIKASQYEGSRAAPYQPTGAEKAVLQYLKSEYEQDRATTESARIRHDCAQAMHEGTFLQDPEDQGPFREMYIPFVRLSQETKVDLHMSRLYPDPSSFHTVQVQLDDAVTEEFRQTYAEQNGLLPEQVETEMGYLYSALLRRFLCPSNFFDARRQMAMNKRTFGWCLGYVEKTWGSPKEDPFRDIYQDESVVEYEEGPEGEFLMEIRGLTGDDDTGQRFTGLRFDCISPANLTVGDLRASCIRELPYVSIYNRRGWRFLYDNRLRRDKVTGEVFGMYANVKSIRPEQALWHGEQQDSNTWDDYSGDYSSNTTQAQGPANRNFATQMRIGAFRIEDLALLCKDVPSADQWRSFCKKFGVKYEELWSCDQWIIEWIGGDDSDGKEVLIRFQPIPGAYGTALRDMFVEAVHWPQLGRTFGLGDYAAGAGDLELMANSLFKSILTNTVMIADPMYAYDKNAIDPRFRETMQDRLSYIAGQLIPVTGSPKNANGRIMEPVGPDGSSVAMGQQQLQYLIDLIDKFVGYYRQFAGGRSYAETATEASIQDQYADQGMKAAATSEEINLDAPLLRRALVLILDEIRARGGARFTLSKRDLEMWGDKYKDYTSLEMVITPEMVQWSASVKITTATSTGTMSEKRMRLERFVGMVQQLIPVLVAQKIQPNAVAILEDIGELDGLPRGQYFVPLDPMAIELLAGKPRNASPTYQRTAPELSAPGEPMPGEAPPPGTPQNVASAMLQAQGPEPQFGGM